MINPSEKACFNVCTVCARCEDKGKFAKCNTCSGHHDPSGQRDPYYIDDYCRCKEGILQYFTKSGKLVIRKYPHNPFKVAGPQSDVETQDERDWNAWLEDARERIGDETYDPVAFDDGTSTRNWTKEHREGRGY